MRTASTPPAISPVALNPQRSGQFVVADVAEARQLGPRTDIAEDETLAAVLGKSGGGLKGQGGGFEVELISFVFKPEFGQRHRRSAESVGNHHVGTGLEITGVNVADQVGARAGQDVGAVFLAPVILFHVQVRRLDARAHGAVAKQNPFAEDIENMRHDYPSSRGSGDGSGRTPRMWQMA